MVVLPTADYKKLSTLVEYLHNNTTKVTERANVGDQYPKVAKKLKQSQKPFSEAEKLAIIADYAGGAMMKELSKKYGRHRGHLSELLVERGIQLRYISPTTRGREDGMVKMYESGSSSNAIAEDLGISQNAVLQCLRKQGVAMRPAGRTKRCSRPK